MSKAFLTLCSAFAVSPEYVARAQCLISRRVFRKMFDGVNKALRCLWQLMLHPEPHRLAYSCALFSAPGPTACEQQSKGQSKLETVKQ